MYHGINIVDKHQDREYSALATNNGVVLCDKYEGAFLVLRSATDLERLKRILSEIRVFDQQCDHVDTSKWQPCNQACDPEFAGYKSKSCTCAAAKAAMGEKQ